MREWSAGRNISGILSLAKRVRAKVSQLTSHFMGCVIPFYTVESYELVYIWVAASRQLLINVSHHCIEFVPLRKKSPCSLLSGYIAKLSKKKKKERKEKKKERKEKRVMNDFLTRNVQIYPRIGILWRTE